MSLPALIGISGYARSGKDTIAKILGELYGYERVSFADQLRGFIYRQDLYMPGPDDVRWRMNESHNRKWAGVRLNEVIDTFGWDEAKVRFPWVRQIQINTGTEAGRAMDPDLWVKAAIANAPAGKLLVFPDTRFNNERDAILERGGEVWRVFRKGVGPVSDHPSETQQDAWECNRYFHNNGTVRDLANQVIEEMA